MTYFLLIACLCFGGALALYLMGLVIIMFLSGPFGLGMGCGSRCTCVEPESFDLTPVHKLSPYSFLEFLKEEKKQVEFVPEEWKYSDQKFETHLLKPDKP